MIKRQLGRKQHTGEVMIKVKWYHSLLTAIMILAIAAGCNTKEDSEVSGEIVGGYRLLNFIPDRTDTSLKVYRGDYIRFDMRGSGPGKKYLSIPGMDISQDLNPRDAVTPYFKMRQTGKFRFSLETMAGFLEVIEYEKPQYVAVTAMEAAALIRDRQPFILDVRREREYRSGHLEGATLVPVQELQKRIREVNQDRSEPVLIYCASGNRSTVASKILIDHGFRNIYNLKYGIKEWKRKSLPVIK